MALIIGIVAVLIIIFGFLCYKKAPPTEAIVVTGFGLSKPKVVSGKGTFVLPVLQRADKLNMRLLKIDVKTPETGVKTQNGVSLWIDSVVTIQVYSENSTVLDDEVKASGLKDAKAYIMSRQQAAISNFLGMNEQGINDKVNDVLQGNLREIVSDMTVDQILTNRKQMALSVIENARPDLAKMGLEVVTFNVQDIRDAIDAQGHNHGVIEAIGIEQEELVKKQAEIARAQAARDVACAKANDSIPDWSLLSLEEILFIFRSYIWLAKLALVSDGEFTIGAPIAMALNAAIAFRQAPILHDSCDSEKHQRVGRYHGSCIVVRALFVVLRDMVGDAEANRELREEMESIARLDSAFLVGG